MQKIHRTSLISTKLVLKLCFAGIGQVPYGGYTYVYTQIHRLGKLSVNHIVNL